MNQDLVIDLAKEAVYNIIILSGPVLLIALVVGLLVSIFQTITSIQEQTLAFVPKILAVFIGIMIFGPWMMNKLVEIFVKICDQFTVFIYK